MRTVPDRTINSTRFLLLFQPELAECLFNYLDTDKTGLLTFTKFIERLEFIVEANDLEKVEFLFKIFDRDCSFRCDKKKKYR